MEQNTLPMLIDLAQLDIDNQKNYRDAIKNSLDVPEEVLKLVVMLSNEVVILDKVVILSTAKDHYPIHIYYL